MISDMTLPYRTDWDEMLNVLDYAKGSGVERSALDARFGAGEAMRETLNALDQLGLIARDDSSLVRLSEPGERLAYAPTDEGKRHTLVEVMLVYEPYQIPLERAVQERLEVIEGPWVEHVWQVDMRLAQPRNRVEEARTFFLRLAAAAGLGIYRRGVRGQTTRLELDPEFSQVISQVSDHENRNVVDQDSSSVNSIEQRADSDAGAGQFARQFLTSNSAGFGRVTQDDDAPVQISVQVDMTDWDLEKIKSFLQLIGYPIQDEA